MRQGASGPIDKVLDLLSPLSDVSIHIQHPTASVLELRDVWPGLHHGASYTLMLHHVPYSRFGDQHPVDDAPAAPQLATTEAGSATLTTL